MIVGSFAFGLFAVGFSGFDLEGGFCTSPDVSLSDFFEEVLERFGGGGAGRSGEATRFRAGMLRALGRGFSGAFGVGSVAGLAEAARADRLGGIWGVKERQSQLATETVVARDLRVVVLCLLRTCY